MGYPNWNKNKRTKSSYYCQLNFRISKQSRQKIDQLKDWGYDPFPEIKETVRIKLNELVAKVGKGRENEAPDDLSEDEDHDG